MKKINIMYIPSLEDGGCYYYRCLTPMTSLKQRFPEKYEIRITNRLNEAWQCLSDSSILIIHNGLYSNDIQFKIWNLIAEANKIGVKTILDIDDYWNYGDRHPLRNLCLNDRYPIKQMVNLNMFNCVTTTTKRLRDEIFQYNKNVHILENAISVNDSQFSKDKSQSDRIRFGITGGSSHINDLKQMFSDDDNVLNHIPLEYLDRIQIVLCGFCIDGKRVTIDENGNLVLSPLNPDEIWWVQLEKQITKDYSIVSPEYKELLLKYDRTDEQFDASNEPYRRVWSKSIANFEYGHIYKDIDVLLVPLEQTCFNNHKCITADSLISTENGVYRICDLVDGNIKCKTDGGYNIINHFKYSNQKTIRLITEYGYEIEGTKTHKLFVNNEWKKLSDFKIGDEIELSKPVFLQTEYQELSYPMLVTKGTDNKSEFAEEDMLPKVIINEKWGRLFGYMTGDGCYKKSGLSISCDSRYNDIVEDVTSLIKSIGLKPKLYPKKVDPRCNKTLSKYGFGVDIIACSGTFYKMSRKYGLCGDNGKNFHVPDFIFKSPKSVIKEFLRGLFESDGSVSNETGVTFTTKSIELAKEVQYLLLGFGITCRITRIYNKYYNKYYYTLQLRKEESIVFNNEIGFVSDRKNEKLRVFVSRKNSNHHIKMNFKTKIIKIEESINDVYDIEVDEIHMFNANGIINHNSELKMSEAGFTNTAIITSSVAPYSDYGTDFRNCLFVKDMNPAGWAYKIIELVNNNKLRKDITDSLCNKVMQERSIELITLKRDKLYSKILHK